MIREVFFSEFRVYICIGLYLVEYIVLENIPDIFLYKLIVVISKYLISTNKPINFYANIHENLQLWISSCSYH